MSDADPRRLAHDWFPHPLPACVAVGARSWIYSAFAFIHNRCTRPGAVRIGCDTGIYNGSFFELGPDAEVAIGDYCALVGAILSTNGRIRIEDYTFIAHEVVFADHALAVPPYPENDFNATADRATSARGIHLGPNCWVGMRAVLLAGTDLAEGCVVGAGAVVNFAAPPFSIIAGNPARIVGTAA